MIKKLIAIFTIILAVAASFQLNLYAFDSSGSIIYDNADIFSSSEEEELNKSISELSEKLSCNILFVSTNSTDGKEIKTYAADYYDDLYGIDSDGLIYVVDFGTRSIALISRGKAAEYIDDSKINIIKDVTAPYFTNKKYTTAFTEFLNMVDKHYQNDISNSDDTAVPTIGGSIIYDNADIFSATEEEELNKSIAVLSEKLSWNIAFVSTNTTDGKEIKMYAADYYDDLFGINTNGIIYAVDFGTRSFAAVTSGEAILYLDDSRTDSIIDKTTSYLSTEDYFGACTKFLNMVDSYYQRGIPKSNADYTINDSGDYEQISPADGDFSFATLGVTILVGFIICIIFILNVNQRYKTYKSTPAENYLDSSQSGYRIRTDTLVNSHTSSRYIPPPSSSGRSGGGGSSTFSSSRGGRHGGSSGKF